jgi:1-acyl-sn-glycerol-3-phosphate acyltransferase
MVRTMAPQPTMIERQARLLVRVLTWLFFRRIEVAGTEHLPSDRGALLVAWHPNGIVDPGLIFARCPHRVVFGAAHGLFRWPGFGTLLRALGTVPVYRRQDAGSRNIDSLRQRNESSLDQLATAIADGSYSALFPEGMSHDEPHPLSLKTGAARLYYRARAVREAGSPPPQIIPVGLHYDRKQLYRSNALVEFHAPLDLAEALDVDPPDDEGEQASRDRCRALTDRIEEALNRASLATENWQLHTLMHRARKLIRAERAHRAGADPGRVAIDEKILGMARIWTGYQERLTTDPAHVETLVHRVAEYDADLAALGIEDHELDHAPRLMSLWLPLLLLLQLVGVFLFLPPIVLAGYILNLPTALGITALCKVAARERKDEASIKVLVGAVAFPLTWALWMALAAWGQLEAYQFFPGLPRAPLQAAGSVLAMAVIGGALSLRYLRVAQETLRSVRVRLTRRLRTRAVARLRQERHLLHDALIAIAEGVDLPGAVADDGRITTAVDTAPVPEGEASP